MQTHEATDNTMAPSTIWAIVLNHALIPKEARSIFVTGTKERKYFQGKLAAAEREASPMHEAIVRGMLTAKGEDTLHLDKELGLWDISGKCKQCKIYKR